MNSENTADIVPQDNIRECLKLSRKLRKIAMNLDRVLNGDPISKTDFFSAGIAAGMRMAAGCAEVQAELIQRSSPVVELQTESGATR